MGTGSIAVNAASRLACYITRPRKPASSSRELVQTVRKGRLALAQPPEAAGPPPTKRHTGSAPHQPKRASAAKRWMPRCSVARRSSSTPQQLAVPPGSLSSPSSLCASSSSV